MESDFTSAGNMNAEFNLSKGSKRIGRCPVSVMVALAVVDWATWNWAADPSGQSNESRLGPRFYRVKLKSFPAQPTGAGNPQNAAAIRIEEVFFRDTDQSYGGSAPEAIVGDGFFQVQMADGTQAYTRHGDFRLASNGMIVTEQGLPVIGMQPFPPSTSGVIASPQGEIVLTGPTGLSNFKILLTRFQNAAGLKRIDSNLFAETLASGPPETGNPGENGFGELGGGFLTLTGSFGFTVRLTEQVGIDVESSLNLRDWTVVASRPIGGRAPVFAGETLIFRDLRQFPGTPVAPFAPVAITTQPLSQVARPGSDVSFRVIASGDPPLRYQWRLNGSDLVGATNATLVIKGVTERVVGKYDVVVSNTEGSVISEPAELELESAPKILSQPISQLVTPGTEAVLQVVALGDPRPTFQWRKNGSPIIGATRSSLRIDLALPIDSGTYSVEVSNQLGSVVSQPAELRVRDPARNDSGLSNNLRERVISSSNYGYIAGNNQTATKEPGEPMHGDLGGGRSLWFGWRVPTNAWVSFDTKGSSFDTILAIYTGTNVGDLKLVVNDDNSGGYFTSKATFRALAGTEYLVAVDGVGNEIGNVVLSWIVDPRPSSEPREDFWDFGWYGVMAATNGVLFIEGLARPPGLGSGAVIDIHSGALDSDFPTARGTIIAVAPDGRGGWFIGGDFFVVGGIELTNLAHIGPDKRVLGDWKPDPNGIVTALAVGEGKLFVGGEFSQIAGKLRSKLSAFNIETSEMTEWNPDVQSDDNNPYPFSDRFSVSALAIGENQVYVGGHFISIGGASRNGLAALDKTTGKALSWNPNPSFWGFNNLPLSRVLSIAVSGNTIYVGGEFQSIGGRPLPSLAAIDANTGNALPWQPLFDKNPLGDVSGKVSSVAVSCNALYVAGSFRRIGGVERAGFAAVNAVTGEVLPWNPGGLEGSQIAIAGETVYVTGPFRFIGGESRSGIAALDLTTGRATQWNPNSFGTSLFQPIAAPQARFLPMVVSGSQLFVGSQVSSTPAQSRSGLMAFDFQNGEPLDWTPDQHLSLSGASAMKIVGNRLYIGSNDSRITNTVVALDLGTGKRLPWIPDWTALFPNLSTNMSLEGHSLAVSDNSVFVVVTQWGRRAVAPPIAIEGWYPVDTRVARFDLQSGSLAWSVKSDSFRSSSQTLEVVGDTLYVAGPFTTIGGVQRNGLAALDVLTGRVKDWDAHAFVPGLYGSRLYGNMLISGDLMYVGGNFTRIGGQPRNGVAALELGTGNATSWNPNLLYPFPPLNLGTVDSLALLHRGLYVSGIFQSIGGQVRNFMGAIDLDSGLPTDWNPNANHKAYNILTLQGGVIARGDFTRVGARFGSNLAVFPPEGSPRVTNSVMQRQLIAGETLVLPLGVAGLSPLYYQWQRNNIKLAGQTNATLVITNAQPTDSGIYTLITRNSLGRVRSLDIPVTVIAPAAITSQPKGQTVNTGPDVTLDVVATGHPPPRYQWRRNGVNIPGAITSSLTLTNAQATDGGTYSVVVANIGAAVNSELAEVIVRSPALPFADNVRDRVITNSFSGLGSGISTNATKEIGEPDHVGKPGRKSLWIGWRAPANGVATFSTRGSGFDTLLAVYTNAAPNLPPDYSNLRPVAGDDDRGGFLTSEVAFSAVAGVEYLIAVDGFGKASGNMVLSWKLDTALTDVPRIFQQPLSQTVGSGETVTLTVTAFSTRPLTYIWIQNCEVIPGATNATLVVTNVQAGRVGRYKVFVSTGSQAVESAPAFVEINFSGDAGTVQKVASRDKLADRGVIGVAATRAFNAPGNRTQLTTVKRENGGGFELLSPGFGGAPARGFVGTQIFHTFGKTKELGEPNHAGEPGGASAWYSVLAEEDGKMLVSTEGSDFDTVVAVYEGPLNPLGYDELVMPALASDNNNGFDHKSSRLIFPAARNRTYHIAVDGVSGVQGQVVLTYQLGSPPEVTAQPVSGAWKVGNVVILVIQVRSRVPVSYQWRLNGLVLAGATNATLVIPVFQIENVGRYGCVVSNFAGVATSSEAMVGVDVTETLRLFGRRLPDGTFSVLIGGTSTSNAVLQVSTNLINWLPIFTNLKSSSDVEFIDPQATMAPWQFYRAIKP